MDCAAYDRWLDAGMPRNEAAARHAGSCARCAASLAAMRDIDAWLEGDAGDATEVPGAPVGFTDAVMRRVAEDSLPVPVRLWNAATTDVLPWWFDALRHPATVLAAALAAVAWWGRAWIAESGYAGVALAHSGWVKMAAAGAASAGALGAVASGLARGAAEMSAALSVFTHPYVALAIAVAALPFLVPLTMRLEHWSERLAGD